MIAAMNTYDITEDTMERIRFHLGWMIQTMDFKNQMTGIDAEDSDELKDAKRLQEELAGRMQA
jgi:hypothetical protein